MPNPTAETQTPVEIGKTNILDQRRRIERQRELIARLERDGSPDFADAVRILGEMEQALAGMEVHHAAAQERPPEASVDEPNPAKVEPLRLTHPWRSSPYRSRRPPARGQTRQGRRRHQGAASLSRASQHPAPHPLYGAGTRSLQGFLAGIIRIASEALDQLRLISTRCQRQDRAAPPEGQDNDRLRAGNTRGS